MYRYPPSLADLPHGDAARAARVIAYVHDEGDVVVEVFEAEGMLLGRTVTALTGGLEMTAHLVLEGSLLTYRQAPRETSLGGQRAIAAVVELRSAQRA